MDEQRLLNKLNCYYGKKLNQELPQIVLTADEACFLTALVSVSLTRGVPNYFKDLEDKVKKLEDWLKYLWENTTFPADKESKESGLLLHDIFTYIKAMDTDIVEVLNSGGYKVVVGAENVLKAIKENAEPGPKLCSGYGVFPNGEKCSGCKDCANIKAMEVKP